MNKRKIKNYYLVSKFQLKLICFFVCINFITISSFYFASSKLITIFFNKGIELGIPQTHAYYSFLNSIKSEMNLNFLKYSAFSTLLVTIGIFVISHKLSGPLYRIKKEFKTMSQNKRLHPFKFRKGDNLEELENYIRIIYDESQK